MAASPADPVDSERPAGPSAGNPFSHAFVAAFVWVGVLLVIAVSVNPQGVDPAAEAFGQFSVAGVLAALPTWLITRRRAPWPFWRLVLLALPFFLLFRLFSVAGQLSS